MPGFSISFGMAIGLTALTFIVEKKEGLLDRSWVAGQLGKLSTYVILNNFYRRHCY